MLPKRANVRVKGHENKGVFSRKTNGVGENVGENLKLHR